MDGFSISWDQSAVGIPDQIVDLAANVHSVSSAALEDGIWYFHLLTCDTLGNCSTPVTVGPFVIDTSAPTNPSTMSSPSHTVGVPSLTDNTIEVNWSADAADPGAGLEGYSILWDDVSNTIPDEVVDLPADTIISTSTALWNGSWYFHLRTCDSLGQCSDTMHIGPFIINLPDITPPVNPSALTSTTHIANQWTNIKMIIVNWTADASDLHGSGVAGYSTLWDQIAGTTPDTTLDHATTVLTETSAALTDGFWYFHLCTCDIQGNCALPIHLGPYKIDATLPTGPTTLTSPSHAEGVTNLTDNTIDVTWSSDSADIGSGMAGFSILWDHSATTDPDATIKKTPTQLATTSPALSDGTWYFHLRACDLTGNCSPTQHLGPYILNLPDGTLCGTITANTTWLEGLTYIVTCDVTINAGVTVTVQPGTIIKFNATSRKLTVNGTLHALGTTDNLIYFTSFKDDMIAGDSNGDGTATSPAKGDWSDITVNDTGTANFDYAVIRFGGYGSTQNLYLTNNAASTIDHSTIANSSYYGVRVNNTSAGKTSHLTIRNSTIEKNGNSGVSISTSGTAACATEVTNSQILQNGSNGFDTTYLSGLKFSNNQVNENLGYALYLPNFNNTMTSFTNNTGTRNSKNGVAITGTISSSFTLPVLDPSLVYILPSTITINTGTSLILPAGTILKMEGTSAGLTVNGTLLAQGSDTSNVYITSIKDDTVGGDTYGDGTSTTPGKGDWSGITVNDTGTTNFDYAVIRYGGYGSTQNLYLTNNAAATIDHSTIASSSYYGVRVNTTTAEKTTRLTVRNSIVENNLSKGIILSTSTGISNPVEVSNTIIRGNGSNGFETNNVANLTFNNNQVLNNTSYALYLTLSGAAAPSLGSLTLSGNSENGVSITGPFAQTSTLTYLPDVAYIIPSSGWIVNSGATLTIEPGTIIKARARTQALDYPAWLDVQGTLDARGTSELPIIFTSSAITPAASDWTGIWLHGSNNSVLENVTIEYAGYFATYTAPYGSTQYYGGYNYNSGRYAGGLFITDSSPKIERSIIRKNGNNGIISGGNSNPIIQYNIIELNQDYAIKNINTNSTINAQNNYWGSSSGPKPYGSGNGINYRTYTCGTPAKTCYDYSYYVDVSPWLGQASTYGRNIPWNTYVADPVNTVNGNYTSQHTDLAVSSRSLPLQFVRGYNSVYPEDGPLGNGWTFNYSMRVDVSTLDSSATVFFGDGHSERFNWDGSAYIPPTGVFSSLAKTGNIFQLKTKDQTTYAFNDQNKLISITDRNVNITNIGYSGVQVSLITAPDGRSLSISYDGSGRINQVSDPLGRTVIYGYDASGNLITATDPENKTTTYMYDANHRMLTVTDPNNHTFVTNVYDSDGRVIEQYDAQNHKTTFFYDIINHKTTVTDSENHTTSYQNDDNLRLTGEMNGLGKTESYTYDANNNRISVTNCNSRTWNYSYDTRGNLLTISDPYSNTSSYTYDEQNNLLSSTDANNQATTHSYDANGNRLSTTDALNDTTNFSYYSDSNRMGLLQSITDALNHTTTFNYNNQGDLISVIDSDGFTKSYEYDAGGRKTSFTDARSNSWTYTYDNLNRLLTETDPLGGVTTTTYDAVGNKLSVEDAAGKQTSFSHNAKDQLVTITDPGGYTTHFTYDTVGNKLIEKDGNDHTTTFGYDAANRLTSITNPLGKTSTFAYDNAGNQTGVTDPLGHTTTTAYDRLNRPTSVTDPLSHTTITTYDAVGNGLTVTDANSYTTTYTYTALNQLETVTDALSGVVTYGYDANGNRTSLTDANGHTTFYGYDALNQLTSTTDPLNHTTSHTYDGNGNRSTSQVANGNTTVYSYDELNRLTGIAYEDSTSVSYSYDEVGNRLSMDDSTGTTSYAYDDLYRPLSIDGPTGSISYTYDAKNRITLTSPAGTTTYSYNAAGLMTSVTDWQNQVTSYTYDSAGRQTMITYPNGVVTTNTYDTADRLTGINTVKDSTTLLAIAYTLDNVGNRLTMVDNDGTTSYTYDELNRLSTVAYPTGTPANVSYTYDPMGNRLAMTQDGIETTYSYNEADQLTSTSTGGTPVNYTWDNAGNMLTKGSQTFTWNLAGKLSGMTNGAVSASYQYNGDGVRLGKTVNGAATAYLQDIAGGLPVVIREVTNNINIDYLNGMDQIALSDANGWIYYHTDGLGSSRALTNNLGVVTDSYSYDAFGSSRTHAGTSLQNFTYTGEQVDPEAGLVYLRARYYDPETGRFINKDNWGGRNDKPQSLNKYIYVVNNPIKSIDPSGAIFEDLVEKGQNINYNLTHPGDYFVGMKNALADPIARGLILDEISDNSDYVKYASATVGFTPGYVVFEAVSKGADLINSSDTMRGMLSVEVPISTGVNRAFEIGVSMAVGKFITDPLAGEVGESIWSLGTRNVGVTFGGWSGQISSYLFKIIAKSSGLSGRLAGLFSNSYNDWLQPGNWYSTGRISENYDWGLPPSQGK